MKKIVFAVISTSATIILFNYSCQKYNLNQDELYDDEYHELAQVIIEDVEKFHRVYLEKGVHEIGVITNSDNDFNLEHIFDAVSGYMEKKEWRFETVDIKSSLNESPVNSLYPYFDMLIANDDNWFSSISNRLKSSEEYNSEELSFDKIEPFTNKIADILSVGSDYTCPEKHFFMVEKKLNDVSAQASNEVNNLELFIINNMISVGLSSLKSWTEILEDSHKTFTKEEKEGEISAIDWEYLGDLAKADAAGGVVGCMSMYKTIVGGLVLGGPKGALAAAGYTFGKGALVGSLAYALAENIMEED